MRSRDIDTDSLELPIPGVPPAPEPRPESGPAPFLGDLDLHLFAEGTHVRAYEKMGAHLRTVDGTAGVNFAVWAPNAAAVQVIGDFNGWAGHAHEMRRRSDAGLWELFVPGLRAGTVYKYRVTARHGEVLEKADPYAFCAELPPRTASIVWEPAQHSWNDHAWMQAREHTDVHASPMSIYEVHPASWARIPEEGHRELDYRELATRLVPYVKEMGYTHVELMPVAEHPFGGSWGYQITGYFAPTRRFGTPDGLAWFIDHMHQNGIGVLLDWVPAHFPKDAHGLARFDGSCLYEHEDPRQGEHRDWGTLIFNYGRHEVLNFLVSNAVYWLEKYHFDGLRVDAVASMLYRDYSRAAGDWVPNVHGGRENLEAIAFLKRLNEVVHRECPGVVTIAEESTAFPGVSRPVAEGGLGFDLKWNMGWMHDTLSYMAREPVHRKWHQKELTFSLCYAFDENFALVLSHDEVVHQKGSLIDKMPGDAWQRFANLRALYGYMYGHPGKKLLFMGADLAQWCEWNHDQSLDWHLLDKPEHAGIAAWVRDLNKLYTAVPALHLLDHASEGFQWIDFEDAERSVVSFVRRAEGHAPVVVLCNFTPSPQRGYRLGVPAPGWYHEVLNSDAAVYGGGGLGNARAIEAEATPWQGQPYSLLLDVPPLAVAYLMPAASPDAAPVHVPARASRASYAPGYGGGFRPRYQPATAIERLGAALQARTERITCD